jgi:hypothetical protein
VARADIIFDNVSSHNDAELQELVGEVEMRRLPRYSPFLTPVESAISSWEAAIKREIAANRDGFIQPTAETRAGQTLVQFCRDELQRFADNTVEERVTQAHCQAWYNHCFSFVPR